MREPIRAVTYSEFSNVTMEKTLKPASHSVEAPASTAVVPMEDSESGFVIPRKVLDSMCPETFSLLNQEHIPRLVANSLFLEREGAERNFEYKQIIPYIVIRHENRYLLIQRTKGQSESRLHNMYSLGIGGHVNPCDAASGDKGIIEAGMRRELSEEIALQAEESCQPVGIINDDSTEVARVHTGLVYLLTTASSSYEILESGKYTAEWMSVEEMRPYYDRMESWAQIVFDFLISTNPENRKHWETRA
jgi:predicted NUDIX family phosphoesterase